MLIFVSNQNMEKPCAVFVANENHPLSELTKRYPIQSLLEQGFDVTRIAEPSLDVINAGKDTSVLAILFDEVTMDYIVEGIDT